MAHDPSPDQLAALGRAVRAERLRLGFTQERLAEESGLHERYLSDIERGRRNVGFLNLVRLARAVELDLGTFMAKVDEELRR